MCEGIILQHPFKNLAPSLNALLAKVENILGVRSSLNPRKSFGCSENFSLKSIFSGTSINAFTAKPKGKL